MTEDKIVISKKIQEDIKLARQCLKFKGFHCENEECGNLTCPLNKWWEGFNKTFQNQRKVKKGDRK